MTRTALGAAREQAVIDQWSARLRWLAMCAPLVALAFVQIPGWTAPDTKLDLTANPGGLLSKVLALWDPTAAGGQLQNQAYGYIFPMGPFFWLGDAIGLPAWVTQRLWWALILVVGFVGTRLLLERLGIGTTPSRVLASYAYALAPRMLIGLGAISSEIWPMAMAPWVLLPLVSASRGQESRAAWRSGVAILLIGAVNAAATIAALIPAALWIMTRSGRHRWPLAGWWAAAVVLATTWWVGPLLLLGRYSPPFLDWIESAAVTTQSASLTEASRGTTQWLAGIVSSGGAGPLWPAGYQVITQRSVIVLGLLIVVGGLVGIWWARGPWSLFVRASLVMGLLLVTLGYSGPVSGSASGLLQQMLDGPLAPFRNTHKFEPVIRIPLVIGLAHSLPRIHAWLRLKRVPRPRLAYAVVVLAVVGQAASPALTGVSQRGPFLTIPDYWNATAQHLAETDDGGRTLVLPGVNGVSTLWGSPRDEPLQPLAESPWIVRDGVPLGSAAATRLLNDIEMRAATGYGGPELRTLLDRLAISRVVLRSDLAPAPGSIPVSVLRSALLSAGLRPEQRLGPLIGGPLQPGDTVNFGLTAAAPAVEIFAITRPATIQPTHLVPLSDVTLLTGGPEGVAAEGQDGTVFLLGDDPRVMDAVDAGAWLTPVPEVVTDSLARRVANFANVRDNYGPLLRADEQYPGPASRHDWLPDWLRELPDDELAARQSVSVWLDGVSARASSSLARPAYGQQLALATGPERAFDLSEETVWQSSGYDPVGQWVEISWPEPENLPGLLNVVFDMDGGSEVAAVLVHTDAGTARTPIDSPSLPGQPDRERFIVPVQVVPGSTTSLRLEVAAVRTNRSTVRVRDIGVGVLPRVERWTRVAQKRGQRESLFSFSALGDRRPSCIATERSIIVCDPANGRAGEESGDLRRVFHVDAEGEFQMGGTVIPREEAVVSRLLQRPDGVVADGRSWIEGPYVAAPLAVDGDPRTYWAAEMEAEEAPTISLTFPQPAQIDGLRFRTSSDVLGQRPTRVRVEFDDERSFRRLVDEDGSVRLPPVTASRMSVSILEADGRQTLTSTGFEPLPVVVGELALSDEGWSPVGLSAGSAVLVPCGFGPTVQVNAITVATEVSGTRADLISGRPLAWTACEPVTLQEGETRFRVLASAEFEAMSARLERAADEDPPSAAGSAALSVQSWTPTRREIVIEGVTDRESVLTIRENWNDGWTASIGDTPLRPLPVDGWAMGWIVPPEASGTISIEFSPQRLYVGFLVLGGLLASCLVGLSVARRPSRDGTVVPETQVHPALRVSFLSLAGLLLIGWAGLLISVVAGALRSLRPSSVPALFAILVTAWVMYAAWSPWPQSGATNRDGLSQILAWSAISLVIWGSRDRAGAQPSALDSSEDGPFERVPADARDGDSDGGRPSHREPEATPEPLEAERRAHPE